MLSELRRVLYADVDDGFSQLYRHHQHAVRHPNYSVYGRAMCIEANYKFGAGAD